MEFNGRRGWVVQPSCTYPFPKLTSQRGEDGLRMRPREKSSHNGRIPQLAQRVQGQVKDLSSKFVGNEPEAK